MLAVVVVCRAATCDRWYCVTAGSATALIVQLIAQSTKTCIIIFNKSYQKGGKQVSNRSVIELDIVTYSYIYPPDLVVLSSPGP